MFEEANLQKKIEYAPPSAPVVGDKVQGEAWSLVADIWQPYRMPILLMVKTILVSYDANEAGMKGAARLQALTRRVRVIQVPWGKDVTEFVFGGGSVKRWLKEVCNG